MRSLQFRLGVLSMTGALLVGLPMCARDTPQTSSPPQVAPPSAGISKATIAAMPLGEVTSRDARGAARFIVGAKQSGLPSLDVDAERAARIHLERHAALLALREDVIRDASLHASHRLANGGAIVQLDQKVDGIDVFQARASVVLDSA